MQSGEGERESVAMAERIGIHATPVQWNAKAVLGTERGESQPTEEKEDSDGRSRFRGRSSRQRPGCKGRLGLIKPRHWSDPLSRRAKRSVFGLRNMLLPKKHLKSI